MVSEARPEVGVYYRDQPPKEFKNHRLNAIENDYLLANDIVQAIDNDADTKIGRLMGDLLAFEGDTLVAGGQQSANPDGGGTGVTIDNIAAADNNNLRLVDNTGVRRQFPETIAITLDFNAALIDDTVAEYVLFYDRTIRTNVTDFVISGASGPTANITDRQIEELYGLAASDTTPGKVG